MFKTFVTVLSLTMLQLLAWADTFTNITTGESFDGYPTQIMRGKDRQVRTGSGAPKYIDLSEWKVERNYLGRNERVTSFEIRGELDLLSQAMEFDEAIRTAANRGPLFILVKLDTPGGPAIITQYFADSILRIDSVDVVCYVTGERAGGAFATGSVLAIAGNKVYMRPGTAIGAYSPFLNGIDMKQPQQPNEYSVMGDGLKQAWMEYAGKVAKMRRRPLLLVQAMIDPELEVIEVTENEKVFLTTPAGKKKEQKVSQTWSRKGVLLALNAEEAAQTRISDGVMATDAELLGAMGLPENTTIIPNRSVERARTVALRAEKQLNTMLATIDGLEAGRVKLSRELDQIELKIKRINDIILRESYGLAGSDPYYQTFPGVDLPKWEDTLVEREEIIADLINVNVELTKKYKSAASIADKHVDLEWHIPIFRKKIEEMEATAQALKARQRVFYPPNMDYDNKYR